MAIFSAKIEIFQHQFLQYPFIFYEGGFTRKKGGFTKKYKIITWLILTCFSETEAIMIVKLNTKSQIETSLILFLKSHINYTEFTLLNQRNLLFSYTLHKYESILHSHNFKRVHRSYLVNMEHVVEVSQTEITLTNGNIIPVSRRRKIKSI